MKKMKVSDKSGSTCLCDKNKSIHTIVVSLSLQFLGSRSRTVTHLTLLVYMLSSRSLKAYDTTLSQKEMSWEIVEC